MIPRRVAAALAAAGVGMAGMFGLVGCASEAPPATGPEPGKQKSTGSTKGEVLEAPPLPPGAKK